MYPATVERNNIPAAAISCAVTLSGVAGGGPSGSSRTFPVFRGGGGDSGEEWKRADMPRVYLRVANSFHAQRSSTPRATPC